MKYLSTLFLINWFQTKYVSTYLPRNCND